MPGQITFHTEAINLARRYSVQNENDLMQETMVDEVAKSYDHNSCEELSHHLLHPKALPKECRKYKDVVTYLKRHDTDTTHGSQVLS